MVDQTSDDGVVWLDDSALAADGRAPLTLGPVELLELLGDVLAEAGIDEVVVTVTVPAPGPGRAPSKDLRGSRPEGALSQTSPWASARGFE